MLPFDGTVSFGGTLSLLAVVFLTGEAADDVADKVVTVSQSSSSPESGDFESMSE